MPKISIIVPVYNAQHFLVDCLDSILSQSLRDFELLLVDDGSQDESLAICREYAQTDSRIQVFHQEDRGQAAARNLALESAKGEYLCFVDSDDRIHPDTLKLLYQAIQDTGARISQCRMLEAVRCPDDFDRPREVEFTAYTVDEAAMTALFDRGEYPAWVACGKLISRELVESYPFTVGRVYEDNEAVCHWVAQAGKLASTREALYFYRGNPDSTTQKAFSKKRLDYLWALDRIIRYYGCLGWGDLQGRFCQLYAQTAATFFRHCESRGWEAEARAIRAQARQLFFRDRISLTKQQFETMLDAFHHKFMGTYWVFEAVYRRIKQLGKGA